MSPTLADCNAERVCMYICALWPVNSGENTGGVFSMHPKSDDESTRVSLVIKG